MFRDNVYNSKETTTKSTTCPLRPIVTFDVFMDYDDYFGISNNRSFNKYNYSLNYKTLINN